MNALKKNSCVNVLVHQCLPSPHPRLARACTSTRCSVKQVVGVLVLYYRALADLATTSDASRDALQKNQCDRRTKKTGGVPSTNPKQWNKKATDIDLSCWDRSIRSNIVFWQSEHLTITPWNVSLVFEVTAIFFAAPGRCPSHYTHYFRVFPHKSTINRFF